MTGKFVRLQSSVLSIYADDGQRSTVLIPADATLQIIASPKEDDILINVLWEGRTFQVFAEDLGDRSVTVEPFTAGA